MSTPPPTAESPGETPGRQINQGAFAQAQGRVPGGGPVVLEPSPFATSYTPPPDSYDELDAAPGVVRPHWRAFEDMLRVLGKSTLARRCEQGRRLIAEHGVSYNMLGDVSGFAREWVLDPLPLILDTSEWELIERAAIQRARLLNLVLRDVYGPQQLLGDGLLPPELVFANPAFLRPCHGTRVPNDWHLSMMALDIGRGVDGRWRVMADRTEEPSGAGYALENRLVLSRVFPEAFRDMHVERLGSFFNALREMLVSMAPRNRHSPRVVLMTHGPRHETYYEHSFLARYLGYTLVEGNDLTVRDSAVFLKTVEGLQPVDVILRHVDSMRADPLEFAVDSPAGVAGLLHATQANTVALANSLGSGMVESPALFAYLPALCRSLLGEELRMPSANTHWCGTAEGLAHVERNLATMVVKSAFPAQRRESHFGDQMSPARRETLMAHIRERPWEWVGQDKVQLSVAPAWRNGATEPRHLVMRVFVIASRDGEGYRVMPGGMTMISKAPGTLRVSMRYEGGSKDTWLVKDEPVSTVGVLPQLTEPVALRRGARDLPSRVVDNLFWLGRYIERADGTARLLRSVVERLTTEARIEDLPEFPALLSVLSERTGIDWSCGAEAGELDADHLAEQLVASLHDAKQPGSLRSTLELLHYSAGNLRDRVSSDTWRILNRLESLFDRPAEDVETRLGDAFDLINQVILTLAAFGGLGMESMTRGTGWRFLDIGRRIERSVDIVQLLAGMMAVERTPDGPFLTALLEAADSTLTYRSRYLLALQTTPVLDLLLLDDNNPRSLVFQVNALEDHVEHLPNLMPDGILSPERRLILELASRIRLAEVHDLCRANKDGERTRLLGIAKYVGDELHRLSDLLTHAYFSHARPARSL